MTQIFSAFASLFSPANTVLAAPLVQGSTAGPTLASAGLIRPGLQSTSDNLGWLASSASTTLPNHGVIIDYSGFGTGPVQETATGVDMTTVTINGNYSLDYDDKSGADNSTVINLSGYQWIDITGSEFNDLLTGLFGDDTLSGGGGADLLFGGIGKDRLNGGSGADQLFGGDDADILFGNSGDDLLDGGSGQDEMYGGSGNDTVRIDNLADVYDGGSNFDTLDVNWAGLGSGSRTWTLDASGGTNNFEFIEGTLGDHDDTVFAMHQRGDLDGGGGTNHVTLDFSGAYAGNTLLFARAFLDSAPSVSQSSYLAITYFYQLSNWDSATLIGTGGNDTFSGTSGDDQIDGHDGDDILDGHFGADVINGGDGDDTIRAGSDAAVDQLNGGDGDDLFQEVRFNDVVRGDDGWDTVELQIIGATSIVYDVFAPGFGNIDLAGVEFITGTLGSGNDTVQTFGGMGTLDAGSGNDSLSITFAGAFLYSAVEFLGQGASGTSTVTLLSGETRSFDLAGFEQMSVVLTQGDDRFFGTDGNDFISGLDGDDVLLGRDGNDVLIGGAGTNTLQGGEGDDTLILSGTNDVAFGNEGADQFVFEHVNPTAGQILAALGDFDAAEDMIDLSAFVQDRALVHLRIDDGMGAFKTVDMATTPAQSRRTGDDMHLILTANQAGSNWVDITMTYGFQVGGHSHVEPLTIRLFEFDLTTLSLDMFTF